MRSISAAHLDQLGGERITGFALVHLDIPGNPYHFTECDVPVALGGVLYLQRPMELSVISYSLSRIVDTATLSIDNLDDLLTPAFASGLAQESPVAMHVVQFDANNQLIGTPPDDHYTPFRGVIDAWNLAEGKVEITVVNDFVRWSQRTLNLHSPSCRWKKFKGAECTYSGAEGWCDRSYARCEALGNAANFGGFRWLPSIEDKNVWWGQSPESE